MKEYEFGYDVRQFERIRLLAKSLSGIEVDESKIDMIYSRLVRIIRQSDFKDFNIYLNVLEKQNSGLDQIFVNAITTNLTSFFRENHHFDLLKSTALPELIHNKKPSKMVKVWSAGCSSGEEAYSILFTLSQFFKDKAHFNYKVYASDIDTHVLHKAKSGIYDMEAVKTIDRQHLQNWFVKGVGLNEGLCRVKDEFRNAIEFFQCNLIQSFKFEHVFDVIFCRNVLIYFDADSQRIILDQFMKHLAPGGFLFTGHSESFMYHYKNTKLIAKTMYRKHL